METKSSFKYVSLTDVYPDESAKLTSYPTSRETIEKNPNSLHVIYGMAVFDDGFELDASLLVLLKAAGWDIDRPASQRYCYGDSDVSTPLISACEMRYVEHVRLLLAHNANPNCVLDGTSPLSAVLSGHSASSPGTNIDLVDEIIHLLYSHGAILGLFESSHEQAKESLDVYLANDETEDVDCVHYVDDGIGCKNVPMTKRLRKYLNNITVTTQTSPTNNKGKKHASEKKKLKVSKPIHINQTEI